MLTYMDPALIVRIKKAALDHQKTAYEIMEEAARAWLEANNKRSPRASRGARFVKDTGRETP